MKKNKNANSSEANKTAAHLEWPSVPGGLTVDNSANVSLRINNIKLLTVDNSPNVFLRNNIERFFRILRLKSADKSSGAQ
jgi:hypothetical protein